MCWSYTSASPRASTGMSSGDLSLYWHKWIFKTKRTQETGKFIVSARNNMTPKNLIPADTHFYYSRIIRPMQDDNESTAPLTFLTYVRVLAQKKPEPIANLTEHHTTSRTHLTNSARAHTHAHTHTHTHTHDCNAEQCCVLTEPDIIIIIITTTTAITITYISPAISLKTDSLTTNKTVTQNNPVCRATASELLAFPNNVYSDKHSRSN